ncbi:hypothetical protein D9758_005694 [Tetrapyrgos nigripes]|uniref:ferric-chelate reductase (NADPH) n=1 Tax=Tetrapyrgos nigripes TaxID=182062 RepID=A0A8H5GJN8_9AGAR|nr:hypothetical protein D9758_005694 [Tetrapyrgos nigripes]
MASPSAQGSAGTAPKQASPQVSVDPEQLVYHIDLILLAALTLFVVLRLPRFLARFLNFGELLNGYVLRSGPNRSPQRRVDFNYDPQSGLPQLASDTSHVMYSEKDARRVGPNGAAVVSSYPPHVSSTPSFLRPTLHLLHKRLVPGVSFSHLCVMAVYLGAWIYPTFYKTNAFTDPVRFGWIAVAQIPWLFIFAAKNNLLSFILGAGYEKLNFMHRFVGRVIVLSVNVHTFGYLYKFLLASTFRESIAKPSNYWGLIATICMDCLFFFSTSFWRSKAYNIFLATHIPCAILVLPATVYHKKATLNWIIPAVVIYCLDVLFRLVSTRFATATVRAIPELSVTRVEIPSIRKGWKAGQHVRLRVISRGMGLFGWTEIHPFTIASVSNSPSGEGLVLLCKKAGGWTGKLYDIARGSGGLSSSFAESADRKVTVMVEGPYGGPGHRIFSSFSAAVFVCGGSGITFGISSIRELIAQDLAGRSRVKVIELIWSVQDPSALVPMLPELTAMIQDSVFTPVRISVFYTRAPTGKFPFSDDFFKSTRLTLSPGRPKVSKHLEETIRRTLSPNMNDSTFDLGARSAMGLSGPGRKDMEAMQKKGMLVGVCGPTSLADSVFVEVGRVDSTRVDQVGGIEVHEETFGW